MDEHARPLAVPDQAMLEEAPLRDVSSLVVRPIQAEEERVWDELMTAHTHLATCAPPSL